MSKLNPNIQNKMCANREVEKKCSNKSLDVSGLAHSRNSKTETFKNNKNDSQYENLCKCSYHSSVINLNGTNYDVSLCKSDATHKCDYQSNNKKSAAKAKLELKNKLIESRLLVADWSLAFGLTGFVLMIAESEFTMNGIYLKVFHYRLF